MVGGGMFGGIEGGIAEDVIGCVYSGGDVDIGPYCGGGGGTLRLWLAVGIGGGRFEGGDEP